MSDVAAVAFISSGASLLGAAIGAVTTYKVSERNATTTEQTVERQAEVELARIRAENDRLRQQIREPERQNRQGTYHRFLAVISRLSSFGDVPPTDEQLWAAEREFDDLFGGLLLFGRPEAADATAPVTLALHKIRRAASEKDPSNPIGVRWQESYRPHARELIEAQGKLAAVMHADVTEGILGDSES
jgi:hypothetical protein